MLDNTTHPIFSVAADVNDIENDVAVGVPDRCGCTVNPGKQRPVIFGLVLPNVIKHGLPLIVLAHKLISYGTHPVN